MNATGHAYRVLAAAIAALSSLAAQADVPAGAFEPAQAEFRRGQRGESGAGERAHDLFEKLSEQEPGNPLYLAYLGSSLTLRGRDAWAPWNKYRYTERGLDLLDKAVANLKPWHETALLRGVPVSLETLLVAASTFLAVPDMFNRLESGKAAVAAALASPALPAAPAELRAEILHQAAIVARKTGKPAEEARSLRDAVALWTGAPFADDARKRLQELGR